MTEQRTTQFVAGLTVNHSLRRTPFRDNITFSELKFKTLKYIPSFHRRYQDAAVVTAFHRTFFPCHNSEYRYKDIQLTPLTPFAVETAESWRNANRPLASLWNATANESFTDPIKPSPFPHRARSIRLPRLRRGFLFLKIQPSAAPCH